MSASPRTPRPPPRCACVHGEQAIYLKQSYIHDDIGIPYDRFHHALTHELSHSWSATHGKNRYLNFEMSRNVGRDFAFTPTAPWQFYERCYPCPEGATSAKDCYAARSAEPAHAK